MKKNVKRIIAALLCTQLTITACPELSVWAAQSIGSRAESIADKILTESKKLAKTASDAESKENQETVADDSDAKKTDEGANTDGNDQKEQKEAETEAAENQTADQVIENEIATDSNSRIDTATDSNSNSNKIKDSTASSSNASKNARRFVKELNGVMISAYAEDGVLPEDAVFEVIELKKTGKTADAYQEASQTLEKDEDTEYDGFLAYDIHFVDENQNEIQPDGDVQISMEVESSALPDDANPTSIEVKHLEENGDLLEVKTVADTEDKADGTVEIKNVTKEELSALKASLKENATKEVYEATVSEVANESDTAEETKAANEESAETKTVAAQAADTENKESAKADDPATETAAVEENTVTNTISEVATSEKMESAVAQISAEETAAETTAETVAEIDDEKETASAETDTQTTKTQFVITADFTVDSFSYFALTYKKQSYIYLHMKTADSNSSDIGDANEELKFGEKFAAGKWLNPLDFGSIYDDDGATGAEKRQNEWISMEALAGTLAAKTEGYTYVATLTKATYEESADSTVAVKWIYYRSRDNTWHYSAETERPTTAPSGTAAIAMSTSNNGIRSGNLYMFYTRNPSNTSEIQDQIETSGCFTVQYLPASNVTYKWYGSNTGEDGDWSEITPAKITGTSWNITTDENGSHLYPALDLVQEDSSVRRWYRAEVYVGDSQTPEKIYTKRQVPYYASLQNGSFETPDPELVNAGKETGEDGDTNRGNGDSGNFTFPNGTTGLIWKTTGVDQQVEIVKKKYGSSHNCTETTDGKDQFAELNAEQFGALYQEVLTQPGSTLHWQFAHRGREANTNGDFEDTMALVIAPVSILKNLETKDQFKALVDALVKGQTSVTITKTDGTLITLNLSGCYGKEFTSETSEVQTDEIESTTYQYVGPGNGSYTLSSSGGWPGGSRRSYRYVGEGNGDYVQVVTYKTTKSPKWTVHKDTDDGNDAYTVPDGQNLTAFFFVARETAGNSDTKGNLLDACSFSANVPDPLPETGNIKITKYVAEIDAEDLLYYRVNVTLESKDTSKNYSQTQTITFNDTVHQSQSTTFTNISDTYGTEFVVTETPCFYVEKEDGTEDTEKEAKLAAKYNLKEQKIQVGSGTETDYLSGNTDAAKASRTINLAVNNTTAAVLTNTYEPAFRTLRISKKVTGNIGNQAQEFVFRIAATDQNGAEVDFTGKTYKKLAGDQSDTFETATSEDGTKTYTFRMSAGDMVEIENLIPTGAVVTVTELDAESYTTTYILDDAKKEDGEDDVQEGKTCTISSINADHIIAFTNHRSIDVPTGLFTDGRPTAWLFLFAAAIGAVFGCGIYRKRKKKLTDGEESL